MAKGDVSRLANSKLSDKQRVIADSDADSLAGQSLMDERSFCSPTRGVSVADIIETVSRHQPILNLDELAHPQQSHDHRILSGIGSLDKATVHQLSFLSNPAYMSSLPNTQAGVVLVPPNCADALPAHSLAIIVKSPYLAYASVSQMFDPTAPSLHGSAHIHPTAQVAGSAVIGDGVSIGAYCIIGEQVHIGCDTQLHSHVVIGDGVTLGERCDLSSHVCIARDCHLGDDVRVHAHASIGSEGFGFAPTDDISNKGWVRIAQLGRVIIGNNVRIGSQTCIDRGAIEDTVIEDNVIIDNLVQVAHNSRIGAGTAIAANTGIAGSSIIGKRCIIGGAVGITGHLEIADDVSLTSMTMVTKSINKSGAYSSGTVAMPSAQWRRAAVRFRNMGKKDSPF